MAAFLPTSGRIASFTYAITSACMSLAAHAARCSSLSPKRDHLKREVLFRQADLGRELSLIRLEHDAAYETGLPRHGPSSHLSRIAEVSSASTSRLGSQPHIQGYHGDSAPETSDHGCGLEHPCRRLENGWYPTLPRVSTTPQRYPSQGLYNPQWQPRIYMHPEYTKRFFSIPFA